jgi:ribosome assembly protein YihI (activator of Der GTPase)
MKWKREEHKMEARQRKKMKKNKNRENGESQNEEEVNEGREPKTTNGVIVFLSFPYQVAHCS